MALTSFRFDNDKQTNLYSHRFFGDFHCWLLNIWNSYPSTSLAQNISKSFEDFISFFALSHLSVFFSYEIEERSTSSSSRFSTFDDYKHAQYKKERIYVIRIYFFKIRRIRINLLTGKRMKIFCSVIELVEYIVRLKKSTFFFFFFFVYVFLFYFLFLLTLFAYLCCPLEVT